MATRTEDVAVFLSAVGPIAFAHRGYSPTGAENSMAAFAAAVDLGFQYLETDARVSADGVAFAFHDDALDRVTDRRGRLRDLPAAAIEQAMIGGTEPVPRLDDVLGSWPDRCFNIDVKSDAAVLATVAVLERTAAVDRVCLAAFSDARVARLRSLLPQACTALGPREVAALAVLARLPRAARRPSTERRWVGNLQGRCVQIPLGAGLLRLAERHLIETAHRCGGVVHVWTVNEELRMVELLDLGVDGIMTDRADVLRSVLTRRGQWPAGTASAPHAQ